MTVYLLWDNSHNWHSQLCGVFADPDTPKAWLEEQRGTAWSDYEVEAATIEKEEVIGNTPIAHNIMERFQPNKTWF